MADDDGGSMGGGGDTGDTSGSSDAGTDNAGTSAAGDAGSETTDTTDISEPTESEPPAEAELYSEPAEDELYDPGYDHSEYEDELLDNSFSDDDTEDETYDRGYDPNEYADELLDFSYENEPQETEPPETAQAPSETVEAEEITEVSADDVNESLKEVDPNYNDPYKPGTTVQELELKEDTTFVRVYDKENSSMKGNWVMEEKDVKGLTPEQIRDKYALPQTPEYKCSVTLKKGTHVRCGVTNGQPGWGKGGGKQYDMMGQRTGTFTNEQKL